MAYEKQTWKDKDVITAEKLNHMEDGIADSSSGEGPLEIKFKITDTKNSIPTAIEQLTNYTGQELYVMAQSGKNLDVILYWDRSPVYYSKAINSYFYANMGPIGMSFTFLYAIDYNTEIGSGDYVLLRFYVSYESTEVKGITTKSIISN